MNASNNSRVALVGAVLFGLGQLGCGNASDEAGSTTTGGTAIFESANPHGPASDDENSQGATGSGGSGNASTATSGTDGGVNGDGGGDGDGDPARAIEEADIVKVVGDRLYAMSRYGGISVIDVSDLDQLELLGRFRIEATPFEMYERDGILFGLYQNYGEYVFDEDGAASWSETSQVVVVDAKDPKAMVELSRFAIPGMISDSRIVGDVLYLAAFENGYCWGCDDSGPRTNVMSLDVARPAEVTKVDELTFADDLDGWGWRRSLSVTDERMYVAGPEWGSERPEGSTIQVIDISDPGGDLVQGASVTVSGQINSRWQMDEHEGVLRVISQPFEWDLSIPPAVETFAIESSAELTPLGSLELELPRPEQLQSVRFDGSRGYAITFERTDPLFTIDLSEPATPVQTGMLEMPGWLYHMEPRGDRLLGLGFDQDNEEGALAVSVFDVSNLAEPVMLSRANFGGDWGWMVEDQDRIHKAFRLFEEEQLILMPFSGWTDGDTSGDFECYGRWVSGVQLFDWSRDRVVARGVAETRSDARRGLLHRDQLLTVSDHRVEAFDISDRDAPTMSSNVALAQIVQKTVAAGDRVLRLGQNWYTNQTELDVVPLSEASVPRSSGGIDVGLSDQTCSSWAYVSDAFARGDSAQLVIDEEIYTEADYKSRTRIVSLDVGDSSAPEVVGDAVIELEPRYYSDYGLALNNAGQRVVQVNSALVFNHQELDWRADRAQVVESGVYVVDLADPKEPQIQFVELPRDLQATQLLVDGDVVTRGRYVQSPNDPDLVRFYVDRIDLSDPAEPRLLPSLNVPGAWLASQDDRALTVDFRHRVRRGITQEECWQQANVVNFEFDGTGRDWQTDPGTCTSLIQVLTLLEIDGDGVAVLGSEQLGADEMLGNIALGDGVLFATLSRPNYYFGYAEGECYDCWYPTENQLRVVTLAGLESGQLRLGRLEIDLGDTWYYGSLLGAAGKRAVVSNGWRGQLSVIDASKPEAPRLVREVEVPGYVQHLSMSDSTAIVSLGYDGVHTVDISE